MLLLSGIQLIATRFFFDQHRPADNLEIMRDNHKEQPLILINQPNLFLILKLLPPSKSWDRKRATLTHKLLAVFDLNDPLLNSEQIGSIVLNSHVQLLTTPKYLLDRESASGIERIALLNFISLIEQDHPSLRQHYHNKVILNRHNIWILRHFSVYSRTYHY